MHTMQYCRVIEKNQVQARQSADKDGTDMQWVKGDLFKKRCWGIPVGTPSHFESYNFLL